MTILDPLPIHYDADVNGLVKQSQSFQIFLLCAFNVGLDQASLSNQKKKKSITVNIVTNIMFEKL